MVVPTLDEEIYDTHLLLMMSCVLELPAKNFPISSKRSRVVTLEFKGGLQDTPAILESSLRLCRQLEVTRLFCNLPL